MIGKIGLYDTLWAIILPTAAFAMPVAVLVLSGTMRDVSEEMYEAMALDGASPVRMLWQLAVPPCPRPGSARWRSSPPCRRGTASSSR